MDSRIFSEGNFRIAWVCRLAAPHCDPRQARRLFQHWSGEALMNANPRKVL